MSRARASRYPIGTEVLLLSVDPVAASAWLRMPLVTLLDQVVPLGEIDPARACQLAMRFAAGNGRDLLAPWGAPAAFGRITAAARLLEEGEGVGAAAAAVGLSARHLTRAFRETTGLHPKRYQRIVRLRRAVIAAKRRVGLAEAALIGGYADQSHFTRDVRALTGLSPTRMLPDVGNLQDLPLQPRLSTLDGRSLPSDAW